MFLFYFFASLARRLRNFVVFWFFWIFKIHCFYLNFYRESIFVETIFKKNVFFRWQWKPIESSQISNQIWLESISISFVISAQKFDSNQNKKTFNIHLIYIYFFIIVWESFKCTFDVSLMFFDWNSWWSNLTLNIH